MTTAADYLVATLEHAGVKRIYGVVGDSINPIVDAIRRTDGKLRWIYTRNEEVGAFAAGSSCGHESTVVVIAATF